MELGFAAPGNRENHADAEDENVAKGNAEKRIHVGDVENVLVEAAHDDSDDEAEHAHHGCESDAEPAEEAMDSDVARAHKRRLKDVERYPQGEGGAMNPEKERPRRRAMEEVGVDGVAESP